MEAAATTLLFTGVTLGKLPTPADGNVRLGSNCTSSLQPPAAATDAEQRYVWPSAPAQQPGGKGLSVEYGRQFASTSAAAAARWQQQQPECEPTVFANEDWLAVCNDLSLNERARELCSARATVVGWHKFHSRSWYLKFLLHKQVLFLC